MARPLFEIADVIRRADARISSRHRESLTWPQLKVLNAILRCRTAALGGHRDQCTRCGYQAISYNSCRYRHCPKCQTNAREKWFPRIRYFGFLANRRRGVFLPLCRTLLPAAPPVEAAHTAEPAVRLCPCCQGPMRILEFPTAKQIRGEEIRQVPVLDTS